MNPYCCRWTHHETNRNMKRKFKGHDKDLEESAMYEFLCQLDVMLQSLTNWLSYAAIIVAVALALCQLIYFIIEKKENHHEHL